MQISQHSLNEVQNRVQIEEIVSDFVSLKKKGSNLWACCPFHEEKTPSFSVSPTKGIYKCFGCGRAGDAIQFIMEIEGLSFVEAVKYLADKYGITLETANDDAKAEERYNERESMFIVMNFAKDYYQDLLWKNEEGQSIGYTYFRERGFSDDTIRNFELGYSLDQWEALLKEADSKGHQKELLEKTGLVIAKENRTYDRFRGRVIFPIHNISGKVIAFGARTLKKDKKQPKYLNSPETEIYHKSKSLYGIFQGKQYIRQLDNCYLVEGYTDVISMHQSGVPNVVASSGTSLTEDQIKIIGRYTKNVTVLFDGDTAGVKASLRGVDMILAGDMNVKVVLFPEGEDPDSYAQQVGPSAFQKYLREQAQDFINFKVSLYAEEAVNDPIKKAETIKEIVGSISRIPDPVKRAVYIKESSVLLDIDESILIGEQNKLLIDDQRKKSRNKSADSVPASPPFEVTEEPKLDLDEIIHLQERESLRILLNYGSEILKDKNIDQEVVCNYFLKEADDIQFSHPVYSEILVEFRQHLEEGEVLDANHFMRHQQEEIKKVVIDLVTSRHEVSENWSAKYSIHVPSELDLLKSVTYTNILRLKFRIVRKLIQDNMDHLKDTENVMVLEKHLKIHQDLKTLEMQIAEALGNVTA